MANVDEVVEVPEAIKANTLIAKLAEAFEAVDHVAKRGQNQKQNYAYVKATDIAAALRKELFSRKVLLITDEKEYKLLRMVKTNSGGEMPHFVLHAEYTFLDGDSGERLGPFGAHAEGMDSGDKAIYKCTTGLVKKILRAVGLVPDEATDPEADETVDQFTSRPTTSEVQGVDVEFDQRSYPPADYDDSQLLDAPPKRPVAPGTCAECGGKIIPAGVSKKTGKPYPAFCKDCKKSPK
jgi:hypothetical protein